MITPERLGELRALADAATPGPWTHDLNAVRPADPYWSTVALTFLLPESRPGQHRDDAVFIAAARSAVPDLLDEIDRLTRELDAMEAERDNALYAAAAFAALEAIQAGEWDRFLVRLQAACKMRMQTQEWADHIVVGPVTAPEPSLDVARPRPYPHQIQRLWALDLDEDRNPRQAHLIIDPEEAPPQNQWPSVITAACGQRFTRTDNLNTGYWSEPDGQLPLSGPRDIHCGI